MAVAFEITCAYDFVLSLSLEEGQLCYMFA